MTDDDIAYRPESDAFPTPRKRKKTTWPWLVVGLVVAVILAAIAGVAGYSPDPEGSAAYNLGYGIGSTLSRTLIITGLIYLPIWLFAVRPAKKRNGVKYFAVLLSATFAISVLATLLSAVVADDTRAKEAFRTTVAEAFAESDRQRDALRAELDKVQDDQVFTPRAMKAPGGYRRAREEAARRRALIAKARADGKALRLRTRERIGATIRSEFQRESALRAFDAGGESRRAEFDGYWALQEDSLKNLEAQIAVLERAPWQLQGGEIAFHRQSDLNAFRRLAAENARLTDEIRQAERELNARTAEAQDRVERAVGPLTPET